MKKEEKKISKKSKDVKKGKKDKKIKKDNLFKGIKREMKKVSWPSKKDIIKYSMATLIFCIVVVLFFQILNLLLSVVKGVFN